MEASHSRSRRGHSRGFTLIETLVAMFILSIGLMGAAALITQTTAQTSISRYAGMESMLASEKLEDLSRYGKDDPHVCVAAGGTAGSLAAPVTGLAVSCPAPYAGNTATVDYADTVQITVASGSLTETYVTTGGNSTTRITPNTATPTATVAAAPVPTADTLVFNRLWVIEKDQPTPGVRRVTVQVTLQTQLQSATGMQVPPLQMTMVRP
jgi:prepilin-type N-terminal cleavage/methylation domain-containing protein